MKVKDYNQLPSERAQEIVQTLWKRAAIISDDDIELKKINGKKVLNIILYHSFSNFDIETLQKLRPKSFRFCVTLNARSYSLDIFI